MIDFGIGMCFILIGVGVMTYFTSKAEHQEAKTKMLEYIFNNYKQLLLLF